MYSGLTILESNIIFENPKTMGLIGWQKNFILPLNNIASICYVSTWLGDDEAEVLVFIDNHSNEFDVNVNYISEGFYEALSHYTNTNLAEKISRLRNMLNKSAVIYSTIQGYSVDKDFEIKWTLTNLVKSILNIFSLRNPLFGFVKLPVLRHVPQGMSKGK